MLLPQHTTTDSPVALGRAHAAGNQSKTCPHCHQTVPLDYHPPSTSAENELVSSVCPACWVTRHLNRSRDSLGDSTYDEPMALLTEWPASDDLRSLPSETPPSRAQPKRDVLIDGNSPTSPIITPSDPIAILRPFRASTDEVEHITYRPSPINVDVYDPSHFTTSSPSNSSASSPPLSPNPHRERSPSLIERSRISRRSGAVTETFVAPSPYTDITRLRVKSQGMGPLYPGSTFSGKQSSGPNSYDVTVTIVVSAWIHCTADELRLTLLGTQSGRRFFLFRVVRVPANSKPYRRLSDAYHLFRRGNHRVPLWVCHRGRLGRQ